MLLCYTDGITEAFNPTNQLFGFARLDDSLAAAHPTARHAIDTVLSAVAAWSQGRPPADDQTMLALRLI